MSAAPAPAPIHWPDYVQPLTRLKGAAYRLLVAYAQRARRTGERLGEAWPSNETLEEDTGYSRRAIQYGRRQLEQWGVLEVDRYDRYGRAVVRLLHPSQWRLGGKSPDFSGGGGAKTAPQEAQNLRPNTRKENTLNPPPTPRDAGDGAAASDLGKETEPHAPSAGQAPDAEKGREAAAPLTHSEQAPAPTITHPEPSSEPPPPSEERRPIAEKTEPAAPSLHASTAETAAALNAYREVAQRHGWPIPVGRLERPIRRAVAALGGLEAWRAMLASAGASPFWREVIRTKGGVCAAIRHAVKIANACAAPAPAQAGGAPGGDPAAAGAGQALEGRPWQRAILGDLQTVTEAFEAIPAAQRAALAEKAKAAGASGRIEAMRFALWTLRQERRAAQGGPQALEVRPWQMAKLGDYHAVEDAFYAIPAAQREALAAEAKAAGVVGKVEARRFAVWKSLGTNAKRTTVDLANAESTSADLVKAHLATVASTLANSGGRHA